MATPKLDAPALHSRLAEGGVTLIDVHPEDSFHHLHLPGARNACVYNVGFLDDVRGISPDPSVPIVVYGGSDRSKASATAREKLEEAGYTAVVDFPGGIEEWVAAGFGVEAREGASVAEEDVSGVFEVDCKESVIHWTGRNFNGFHSGTLRPSGGTVRMLSGALESAEFSIDVTSIENEDISDESMRGMLIGHLLSDDFLNAEAHPVATLAIDTATPIAGAAAGDPNMVLAGSLTLNGVERRLVFPASVGLDDGLLRAAAEFEIDRTRWGIVYGSHRFYEALGKHFVSDLIELKVELVAR
jgi:rhodanese-related sulfurtransferase